MEIEKTLKEIRQEKQLKQIDAAKLVGISQTHLSQLENGKKNASVDVLKKFAKAYNLPLAVIFIRSLDENDVDKSKRLTFKKLMPALKDITKSIWNG